MQVKNENQSVLAKEVRIIPAWGWVLAVIGFVGCYKGYTAGHGTESVGIAANSAVVLSSLLVIIIDLIAVQITDML